MADATAASSESTRARLTRRKAVRWGIACVAGAWGLLQRIGFSAEAFHWLDPINGVNALAIRTCLTIQRVMANEVAWM